MSAMTNARRSFARRGLWSRACAGGRLLTAIIADDHHFPHIYLTRALYGQAGSIYAELLYIYAFLVTLRQYRDISFYMHIA